MINKSDKGIRSQRTQETLRTSEVRYRRLFETAKDGILLLDADTARITDVNPFLEDMLGYSHTELIGKALWAHLHKKAHMTCELSPYSCMPNTMSIGAMGAVLGKYPDLLYAPLEIKGDAEVHALSRCQMILTEAKKRAQKEFQEVLDKTNLTEGKLRERVDLHPELKQATYRVPRYGAAGTAANLALHLASC